MPIIVTLNIIPEITAAIEPRLKAVLMDGGQQMLDAAKGQMGTYPPASAPGGFPARRGGELANNTEVKDAGKTVEVWWHAPYAAFVNYGTRKMAPRPFAEPAVEMVKPKLEAAVRAVVP